MANDDDGIVHDEVEIEDFEYDPNNETFTYPCPCGDEFVVTRVSLLISIMTNRRQLALQIT